jgi:molybdopterin synthase sulfur carrier subunit
VKNPKPANLLTTDAIRGAGWAAEARDDDGHLMTTHNYFTSDEEIVRYVRECVSEGWVCTIFPKESKR